MARPEGKKRWYKTIECLTEPTRLKKGTQTLRVDSFSGLALGGGGKRLAVDAQWSRAGSDQGRLSHFTAASVRVLTCSFSKTRSR